MCTGCSCRSSDAGIGKSSVRLTIAIAPYEIGAYAEGSYKINVPMTGALVKVVKDEFARDFLPIN